MNMKTNTLNEVDIERMLLARARHAAEGRMLCDIDRNYRRYSRRVALHHYAATCCMLTVVCCILAVATPKARASATSRCTLEQRHTAIVTSEQIIHAL